MRDDVAAHVSRWDKKTAKKAKKHAAFLDDLDSALGSENAEAVEPCQTRTPGPDWGAWGILCLTTTCLLFERGSRRPVRFKLEDINELGHSLVSGKVMEVRVGGEPRYFEFATDAAASRFRYPLVEAVKRAKH